MDIATSQVDSGSMFRNILELSSIICHGDSGYQVIKIGLDVFDQKRMLRVPQSK